tara:strand:+ start:52 stop:576 length:525 start_codon:yes stop_codon:yes gene_type:complete
MAIKYGDGTDSDGGRVIRVEKEVSTTTASTSDSSASYSDVFNIAITPQSTSSKFLLIADLKLGFSNYRCAAFWKFVRTISGDASYDLMIGDASSSRQVCTWGTEEPSDSNNAIYELHSTNGIYLDTPNTTTACSFKVMWKCTDETVYLNRTGADNDGIHYPRAASSLTVMEIAG